MQGLRVRNVSQITEMWSLTLHLSLSVLSPVLYCYPDLLFSLAVVALLLATVLLFPLWGVFQERYVLVF